MNAKMRTLYIIVLDYLTILGCYFGCRLFLPSISGGDAEFEFARTVAAMITVLCVYPLVFKITGIYKIIHRYAQSTEYLRFLMTFLFSGAIFCGVMFVEGKIFVQLAYDMSFLVIVAVVSAAFMLFSRIVYRVYINRVDTASADTNSRNVLIVGCGQACLMLLNEIKYHPEHGLHPVVAVDVDKSKIGRKIGGIEIEGTDENIPELCKKHDVDLIIIAIPSADNKQRAKILQNCHDTDIEVKLLPRVSDFHENDADIVNKLRAVTMDELLGREPIDIRKTEINEFIKGKTVLVTGGGGSIGSELCRQIASNSPKKLIILDIYENNAYDIQQELIYNHGEALDLEVIIASVRDAKRMNSIMNYYKPDLVIHAAAHKHVPLMEVSPQEAIKNNVIGTYNTARAAIENGVKKFILISTDKAVNPTNIMGASKRLCEMIIQSLNGSGTTFSAVRFGNVLGSNGSVIPLFRKQIEAGGPVTVTHPDIIRFFITIPEAVQLVLMASTKATGGEIFVLNMGEPVKIDDLAKKLIKLSGKTPGVDIKIEYTGLRPGEKLYEEIMMSDENLEKTQNDKLFIGHFVDFDKETIKREISELEKISNQNELLPEEMMAELEKKIYELVPTFHRAQNQ